MAKSISRRLADSASPTGAIDGTLSTAAQTNITSVGTLSALTVSGALTVDTNTLVVDSTNNRVGIGITPSVKLEVDGGSDGSVVFSGRSDGGNGNNQRFNLIAFSDGGGSGYGGGLKIQTRSSTNVFSDVVTLSSAGNVGINNTSPIYALCISDDSNPNRNGLEIAIGTSDTASNTLQNYNRATSAYTPLNIASSTLTFGVGTSATERMRIDSAGNVGIGTTSPNSYSGYTALTLNHATNGGLLDFELNGTLQGEIYANSANLGLGLQAVGNRGIEFQTNGSIRATIDGTGKVDIHDVGTVYTGAGAGKGTIHLDPNSATNFAGNAITFGASDQGGGQGAQAGIYTRTDGTFGTEMHLSTTDSYAAGSKTGIKISNLGNVTVPRGYMSAKQPAAIVRGQGTFLSAAGTGWQEFDSIVNFTAYSQSSDSPWSDTTGRFTAPIAGYYLCTCSAYVHNVSGQSQATQYLHPQWARNGSVSIMGQTPYQIFGHEMAGTSTTAYAEGMGRSDVVKCAEGDYLTMQIFIQANGNSSTDWRFYGNYCMLTFTFLAAD